VGGNYQIITGGIKPNIGRDSKLNIRDWGTENTGLKLFKIRDCEARKYGTEPRSIHGTGALKTRDILGPVPGFSIRQQQRCDVMLIPVTVPPVMV
jgi:hypothetical protein